MMDNKSIGNHHFSIGEEGNRERLSSSRMKLEESLPEFESSMFPMSMKRSPSFVSGDGDEDGEETAAADKSAQDDCSSFAAFGDNSRNVGSLQALYTLNEGERRRFPCKARNVGDDHTNETAYLDLPPNPYHGYQVVCSHPSCQASGRAFRWCEVCQVIVAKRNFMKRHSHGLLIATRSTGASRRRSREAKKLKNTSSSSQSETLMSMTMSIAEEERIDRETLDAGCVWTQGIKTPQNRLSSNSETVGVLVGKCARDSSFKNNKSSFNSLEPGFLDRAVSLSMREITEDITEDEDDSIVEIGSLNGWDEADLDSIFD